MSPAWGSRLSPVVCIPGAAAAPSLLSFEGVFGSRVGEELCASAWSEGPHGGGRLEEVVLLWWQLFPTHPDPGCLQTSLTSCFKVLAL